MEADAAVSFSVGKAWVDREHGIARVEFLPGTHQDLENAKEEIAAVRQATRGAQLPLLVDLRNVKATDQAARDYFGSPESKSAWRAVAFVTGTPLSNVIANIWLAANNSRENPVKLFSVDAEAVSWLKRFAQ